MDTVDTYFGSDRRKYPRLNKKVKVEYYIHTPPAISYTKNISAGGICISVEEDIAVDTVLFLAVYLSDINFAFPAKAKVVWKKEMPVEVEGKKAYDLGIEFVEINEYNRQKLSEYLYSS